MAMVATATVQHGRGKVLLLHGSRQTGDLLLGRMDKLRKRLEKQNLEIVAPTAAFPHPEDPNLCQWWNRSGDNYQGLLEQTFPDLLKIWDEMKDTKSPFVGILGFSQGARLSHLCCLAHSAQPSEIFPGLQFVLMAAGYEAPLPTGFRETYLKGQEETLEGFVKTPSLHVYGSSDKLIVPQQSRGLLPYYSNPQTHEHEGGHHVPMRAASVRAYEDFIAASRKCGTTRTENQASATMNNAPSMENTVSTTPVPDEETVQLQRDEVDALTAIFPEEFHLLSSFSESEDKYEHPIRFKVDLVASDEGIWPPHQISIEVQYPHNYPQESVARMRLSHDNNMMEFSSGHAEALLNTMQDAAQLEEGMPSVMSCIYAAREFFESGTMVYVKASSEKIETDFEDDQRRNESGEEEGVVSCDDQQEQVVGLVAPSSRERIEELNLQGLKIAEEVLNQMRSVLSENQDNYDDITHGKGGHKTFTIGLIGKPSAGKSTFFNAATAFARQRDDADNLLGGATMAPHPFTTIDPNVGYCLVPAPPGSCPEDELNDSDSAYVIGSTHGRDHQGRRLLPVLLKDVAGLVPGAYQGRGRGNKFLNDLTDADVLVHVLDASGSADVEGNSMGTDIDGTSNPESSNPLNDMQWIRVELVEWVFSNLMFKWETIKRRGRSKLADMFGGYGQTQAVTNNVLMAVEIYMESCTGQERALDNLSSWDEADVHRLVSAFLGVRFPMALALNKCDIPTGSDKAAEIRAALPIHGAHAGTPLSSRSEMNFIRHHILKSRGLEKEESTSEETCDRQIPKGVWDCLQSALQLREPILVFPVLDLVHYRSLPGLFKYATSDPSLPSAGMIQCLEAAGGAAPSLWKPETSSYQTSPDNTKSSSGPILCEALTMKPGSTVDDVFLTLKRLGALGGDFVRAEATSCIGAPSRPVPKTQKLNKSNRILKIMTSKRSAWQK